MTVRFELPFSIYCLSCEKRISQGNRFNAKKVKTGNYYSTAIYQFTLKCHLCSGIIEIRTDPQNTDYAIVSGARRVAEIQASSETDKILRDGSNKDGGEALLNPLATLERDATDRMENLERNKVLSNIYEQNQRQWEDVYGQSRKLRNIHRCQRNVAREKQKQIRKLQDKYSLDLHIEDAKLEDSIAANEVNFKNINSNLRGDAVKTIHKAVKRSLDPWNRDSE